MSKSPQEHMAGSRYSEVNPPPEMIEDIRRRLAGVCADWPSDLFESMTTRAAWIEFKYDRAMTNSFKSLSVRAAMSERLGSRTEREIDAPGL
jgi:hypothetical protein